MKTAKTKPRPRPVTEAAPLAPAAADELAMLPLDKIVASAINPRKTFDPVTLDQLAKSVREKGVLEPIIVRPRKGEPHDYGIAPVDDAAHLFGVWPERLPSSGSHVRKVVGREAALAMVAALGQDHYEIVAGERRVRAARLAGLQVIPAIVRDLDDLAAAEVAVIENDQRDDVPPLEQAEGYAELVRLGDDPAIIAEKIGRPLKYVVGRLQLGSLIPELKEDLRAGKLPFGHALLLSKLQAAEQLDLRDDKYGGLYEFDDVVIPLDALRKEIKQFFGCLSAAPWKKDDETLVPAAGACTKCPKRSGANPTLFDEFLEGEKKGRDLCTDRGCYAKKRDAFIQIQLKKSADANGGGAVKVTTGWSPAGRDVLTKGGYEIVTAKEAKKAKPGTVQTAVVVAGPEDVGQLVHVKVKKSATTPKADAARREREDAERKRKCAAGAAASQKAGGLAAAKAEKVFGALETAPSAIAPIFRALLYHMIDGHGYRGARAIAGRRGLKKGDELARVRNLVENTDPPAELFGLLAEFVVAEATSDWGHFWASHTAKAEAELCRVFGIDRKKLVDAELTALKGAEKDAPEPDKPAKPKKKAKAATR